MDIDKHKRTIPLLQEESKKPQKQDPDSKKCTKRFRRPSTGFRTQDLIGVNDITTTPWKGGEAHLEATCIFKADLIHYSEI